MIDIHNPTAPIYGPRPGSVLRRDDPKGIGRIKGQIPGLLNETPWALPLATLGAGSGMGAWWIPPVGAEVVFLFSHGDPDHPYYLASNWTAKGGEPNVPPEAMDATGKGDPDVYVLAAGDYSITIDNRAGRKKFAIVHRPSGDVIEHDGLIRQWYAKATTSLKIESVGQIDIKALAITLNGRPVLPINQPI